MGEVYRARDTRLDRTVALKILSLDLAADATFKARFEREARTISSLNHPHICVLHDIGQQDGIDFLVLEHLEGETLAERLRSDRPRLKLADALRIAVDVADALDTAHRHHVVHRDLKPANIMLTSGGAKLLDFGLARQPAGAGAAALSMLVTQPGTGIADGTIAGTLQYMAPEQIQGQAVDVRTDVFALGEVIYEMITGRKAFEAQTQASLIAKVLETDPPAPSTLVPVSPPALDHIVQRCLAKEPDDRWQSARDLLLELRWVQQGGGSVHPDTARPRHRWTPWAIATLALAGAVAVWFLRPVAVDSERSVVRFDVPLPPSMSLEDWRGWPTLSPDGRLLVVAGTLEGRQQLFVRRLDEGVFTPVAGTDGARLPFFSPSGRSLAFTANGKLRRAEIAGGPVTVLCDVSATNTEGAWSREGVIVFGSPRTGLFRVPESGGAPKPLTELDTARGDVGHTGPQFLPDGRRFLFTVTSPHGGIYAGSLDSRAVKRVVDERSRGYVVDPGYLVFARQQTLMAAPFDSQRIEMSGPAFPIVSQLFSGQFSATSMGYLAYRLAGDITSQLAWYHRDGRRVASVGAPGPFRQIALSPSGRRVAIQSGEATSTGTGADIWVMDLATDVLSRVVNDPAFDGDPAWAPDERSLMFTTNRTGRRSVFRKDLLTGAEAPLLDYPEALLVDDWTADGRFVIIRTGGRASFSLPMTGDRTPRLLMDTPLIIEDQVHVSPDGRWIAFNSDETGRWEVYIASFPEFSGKRQISSNGGVQPVWRRDSRELFYLSPQGQLMVVAIGAGESVTEAGVPRLLFQTSLNPSPQLGEYAVAPDGQRILIVEPLGGKSQAVTLLLNWRPPAR
jgi:eukaryotic-like serine/threonine-protein kinase